MPAISCKHLDLRLGLIQRHHKHKPTWNSLLRRDHVLKCNRRGQGRHRQAGLEDMLHFGMGNGSIDIAAQGQAGGQSAFAVEGGIDKCLTDIACIEQQISQDG